MVAYQVKQRWHLWNDVVDMIDEDNEWMWPLSTTAVDCLKGAEIIVQKAVQEMANWEWKEKPHIDCEQEYEKKKKENTETSGIN